MTHLGGRYRLAQECTLKLVTPISDLGSFRIAGQSVCSIEKRASARMTKSGKVEGSVIDQFSERGKQTRVHVPSPPSSLFSLLSAVSLAEVGAAPFLDAGAFLDEGALEVEAFLETGSSLSSAESFLADCGSRCKHNQPCHWRFQT